VPAATTSGSPSPGTGQRRLLDRVPGWLVGTGLIGVAMGVMNLSTYGFTVLAARWLGPREYGQLAAAMGLLLILGVVSLGLQATAARRIAASPGLPRRTQHEVMVPTGWASLVVGALTLVAVPVLAPVLRLDLPVAVLVAVAAVPLTLMGGQAGVLQGERRWLPLALLYAAMGLGRLVLGLGALAVDPSASSAMAAVAVGAFVPAVVGAVALRRTPADAGGGGDSGGHARSVIGEVLHNSHALLAFFALSNCDILVARAVLDDHASGLYAGGLILAKAVLFLPQFIVVLVFPSMSADTGRRGVQAKALGLILAMGLAAVATAAVGSPLAVLFVGGSEYAELEGDIWAFAALGTVLAMTQLLVYAVVARQHAAAVFVLWGGLVAVLALTPLIDSVDALLTVMVAVLVCVLVGLGLAGRRPARPTGDASPTPATAD
jgi:O-antigen/teichoic acid export membrane protein